MIQKNSVSAVHPLTRSWKARAAVLFSSLLLIALVAIAAPQRREGREGRDGRDGGVILILSPERIQRDFGGGPGGRPSPDAQCEYGFVAVGFHVQTGEFFNQAWLECAPMRSDGSIGDEHRLTARTGSPGGRPVADAYCRDNQAMFGLRGRTGASIDEAAGVCSPIRDIADRHDAPRADFTQVIARPRAGGRQDQVVCPPGSVITGFRSMSGEYMDHLWIMCSELRRTH